MCCQPEVGPSVVECVAVCVVNQKAFRGIHNFPVQAPSCYLSSYFCASHGVNSRALSAHGPFESTIAIVIQRIEDCKLALTEGNFAEGIAITEQAIGEQWIGENTVEPIWNLDLNS